MEIAEAVQIIWAVLFLWYVIDRLRSIGLREDLEPMWRNPVAAGRRFWRDLWDESVLARGILIAILACFGIGCIVTFVLRAATDGWPTTLGSTSLRPLFDASFSTFWVTLFSPKFWSVTWRDALDAATLYPIFKAGQASLGVAVLLLASALVWVLRNRSQVMRGGRVAPSDMREAASYFTVGAMALVALAVVGAQKSHAGSSDVRLLQAVLSVMIVPVVWGGILGLLALTFARVIHALPLQTDSIMRGWIRLLPSFVMVMALPVLARCVSDLLVPGWETEPINGQIRSAAVAYAVTRLAWLFVLPPILWMAFKRQPLGKAVRQIAPFWVDHGREIVFAALRTAVVMLPVLIIFRAVCVAAPPTGLFPGMATQMASWLIALVLLGAAMESYREIEDITFGVVEARYELPVGRLDPAS